MRNNRTLVNLTARAFSLIACDYTLRVIRVIRCQVIA
jgi:hypothetical protein